MKVSDIVCYRCGKVIFPNSKVPVPCQIQNDVKFMCTKCTLMLIKEAMEGKADENSISV